ncbi:MAG: peptidylprolyl isomerase [Desulfovibrio sp.]|uniref:SurA N-terminal domain-containing protein n=1 Tax=Desulfovibrio sp. TaxID=885 RepID=UPI00135EC4C6|nr:SurA N-terminal domain-containing protein [Desulfovibrio sp.]MTJ92083.1 peptidylprolyl isomerase [Desulfovibrio sp.]
MLEYIRSNSQSLGVKLAFGLIILVFIFWGVGSMKDRGTGSLVATVNGDPITIRDFELAYRNAEEAVVRNNPGATRDQIRQGLGRQVLRDLISQTLVRQEAARAGITVTPLELRIAVGKIPVFQNANGQFDPAVYKRVLEMQRISPAQYEHDMSEDLLRQKLFALVTSAAWHDPAEAQNRYNFLREQRVPDYIFIPAAEFMAGAKPTDAEVTAYYDSHKGEFAVPPKVDVAYIRLTPEGLVKAESISDADARKWYDANASRFNQQEEIKAAHILVPLAEDASETDVKKAQESAAAIEKELKSGKSFADVANAHNGPNAAGPGGELGWLKRGTTVKPFEDAAFALEPGKVSAPVRSQFGLHIIKVEEKKGGGTQSFAAVADEVRKAMAKEQGADKLRDVLDNLIEDNILGKPLEKSAQALGLEAQQTGLAAAQELQQKMGITAEAAATLEKTPANSPVDRALEAGDAYVVARVLKAEAASTLPLEAVKEKIVARLQGEKALADAMRAATERRKSLVDGAINPTLKTGMGIKTANPMDRSGSLADFGPDPELAAALFSARVGQWLPTAFAVSSPKEGQGAVLVHVGAVQPPDASEWDMIKDIMAGAVERERVQGLYETFMQRLLSTAKVEVLNMDIVDRKNM